MFLLISWSKRRAEIYWVAAIKQADLLSVFLFILQKIFHRDHLPVWGCTRWDRAFICMHFICYFCFVTEPLKLPANTKSQSTWLDTDCIIYWSFTLSALQPLWPTSFTLNSSKENEFDNCLVYLASENEISYRCKSPPTICSLFCWPC